MNDRIVELSSITDNAELWGGKAVGLYKLVKNGFIVPDAFVISSDVYSDYLRKALDPIIFEKELLCNLEKNNMINNDLLFRSSSNLEGQKGSSSCGVFNSYKYNRTTSLFENVKTVWDSVNDPFAQSYLSHIRVDLNSVKMAVIVQLLFAGEICGVIHTRDIIEDTDDIVIELVPGSLNTVVDGRVDADIVKFHSSGILKEGFSIPSFANSVCFDRIINMIPKLENVFNSSLEIEFQMKGDNISFVQVRPLF